MKKRFISLLLILAMVLTVSACGQDDNTGETEWAIYWYLCGSDLESWYGCATDDLEEMLAAEIPENVKVVIETGGALEWQKSEIDEDQIDRFVYDKGKLRKVEKQPQADMGDAATLESFLRFCTEKYPAEKQMVLFWDHGGGSVTGSEFDINYSFDSLTIKEFHDAFEAVFGTDAEEPPFEVIGFDACLMATIDVASAFSDFGKYMVASQELEPGNGWYYTGWLQALAEKPEMDGAALGKAICDAYVQGCEMAGTGEDVTLSVTDLSKIDRLLEAYNEMGTAALMGTAEEPAVFTSFSRGAVYAENYGGNTEEEGYTNMVDLGHLCRNNAYLLPDSSVEVQKALDDCIIYKVNGPYRTEASGLSCYHSYNADIENFVDYTEVGCSEAFKYFYGYGLSGELSKAGLQYLQDKGVHEEDIAVDSGMLDISVLEGWDVYIDDYGNAVLDVLPRGAEPIVNVRTKVVMDDGVSDYFRFMGESGQINYDYEEGIFTSQITGYWPSIDGNFVFTRMLYQGEDYTVYSVPVLLNGEEYNLRVVYDHDKQDYTVLGARKGLTDEGMPDKHLVHLQPGDVLTTIYLDRSLTGEGGFDHRAGANITVTEETMFYEAPLPDGRYSFLFEMTDARGKTAWSEMADFELDEGYIYLSYYTSY